MLFPERLFAQYWGGPHLLSPGRTVVALSQALRRISHTVLPHAGPLADDGARLQLFQSARAPL